MEEDFYSDFLSLSKAEQQTKISTDFNGLNLKEISGWENLEGIDVPPVFHRDDVQKSSEPTTLPPVDWEITHRIPCTSDIRRLSEQLNWLTKQDLAVLFLEVGIHWDVVPKILPQLSNIQAKFILVFDSSPPENILEQLATIKNKQICFDPLGQAAQHGSDFNTVFPRVKQYFAKQSSIYVDAALYANAGANCQQQIGYALLHLNEYLSILDQGSNKNPITILVKFAQGSNYFFEIAKLIAFRQLAKLMLAEFSFTFELELIAEPIQRNKTCSDYNVNLLRTTSEMMSAILGEADMVMNHPYDLRFKSNNDFSDRIALNQLRILKHESYFDQLPKATEGSYYLSYLTDQLKEKAWDLFLNHEAKGGWCKQLSNTTIQQEIAHQAEEEQGRIESTTQVLVGTNKYQDKNAPSVHSEIAQQHQTTSEVQKIQPITPSFLK